MNLKFLIPSTRGIFKTMTEEKVFYLTKEGLERIKREFKRLKELRLANPEEAASQEDLSFLESRLIELEHILKNSQLIKPPLKRKQNTVHLGATILVSVDGQDDEFTLVGPLEANPFIGRISNESPVGKALLGHRMGDKIVFASPVKTIYKIKKIKYERTS